MNTKIFTCFGGILFIVVTEGNMFSFDKTTNGLSVKSKRFPYIAELIKNGTGNKISTNCVGAIISNRHIITAGHCVRSKKPLRGVKIVTGTRDFNAGDNFHKIKQIFLYPKYTGGNNYDIRMDLAILSLTIPMTFNSFRTSINLASKNIESASRGIIIGWGLSSYEKNAFVKLQKLEVKNYYAPICQSQTILQLHEDQICSIPAEKSNTCNGASSGILIVNEELAGVVSHEKFPCGFGNPIFCTNIFSFRKFILNVMNKI